jgi:hypothetical protein
MPTHVAAIASLIVALVGVYALVMLGDRIAWQVNLGGDLTIYRDATDRLLAGGSWYLPDQLDGPYDLADQPVLYPPILAWLIAPWLVLPGWLFVALPLAVLAWFVWSCRPAPWTWPILVGALLFPMTPLLAAYANPGLWVAALFALGLRYQ